jgi:RNA polymerase sigma factor (sigma-70 family)
MTQLPESSCNGALAERLEATRPWLRSVLATRTGGDRAVADDLLSGMFTDLLAKPHQCVNVVNLPAWLYRMAVNRAVDQQRRNGRERRAHGLLAEGQANGHKARGHLVCPLDLMIEGERNRVFESAILSLDEADRELLAMKFKQGLSYQQMAERTSADPGQIANRLRTAKARLKSALLESPYAEEFRSLERTRP